MSAARRVLVAEDEKDTRRGLERLLSGHGYSVALAADGREAAQRICSDEFDAVVADLKMPYASGMDLLRSVREMSRDVVFVIITGYGTPEIAVDAMRLGCSNVLTKPFAPAELLAAIKDGLAHVRAASKVTPDVAVPAARIIKLPQGDGWVAPLPDGSCLVGGGEKLLCDEILYCDLPLPGETLSCGQRCVNVVAAGRHTIRSMRSPLNGRVVAVNPQMESAPWEVHGDVFGKAWLFRIEPTDPGEVARLGTDRTWERS
jgi:CheY-like chemotaxis protein/glycine cleavage system H lipoate-binding protein